MALKENYVDDILNTSKNTKRKYNMLPNGDGTVSFEDVTEYSQNGDNFGASDINITNKTVNELIAMGLNVRCNSEGYLEVLVDGVWEQTDLKTYIGNKLYIYKQGNEYESLTGGLNTYNYRLASMIAGLQIAPTLTKHSDYFELTTTNSHATSGSWGILSTKSKIDLSKYSTLKIYITSQTASTHCSTRLAVTNELKDGYTELAEITLNGNGEISLDVSRISEECYIVIGQSAINNGTTKVFVSDIWLEKEGV
ncbi:MAG: hypothetical protein II304_09960 [Bacteroidales bacterium]|nr:hypothetical protein [Bacteroidales bacterium]